MKQVGKFKTYTSDEVLDRSFQVNREQNRRIDYVRGSKMVCDSHLFRL